MEVEALKETTEETAQFEAMLNEQPLPEPKVDPAEIKTDPPKAEAQLEPEKKPEPAPEKAPVRLVPHQALHEERTKRQALERRIAELEGRPAPAPQQQNGDGEPDENTDPIGTIAWLKAKVAKGEEDSRTAQQQAAYVEDLGTKVKARVDAYVVEHPEYLEQVNHVRQSRFAELQLMHPGAAQQAIAAQVLREEMALGEMAVNQDLDIGKMVADLAKHRGWKPKEPEPASVETKPAAEAEATIARLTKGQKAAVSPSGSGGGAPQADMTLERLLELDGAAFDEAFKKHGPRLMQ